MWQQSWSVSRKHASMPASYNLRFCCWPALVVCSPFWQQLIQNPLKLYGTVLLGSQWFSTVYRANKWSCHISCFMDWLKDRYAFFQVLSVNTTLKWPREEMPSWDDYSLGSEDEMHSAPSMQKINFPLSKYEAAPVWYIQIESSIVMVLITGNSHFVSVMIAFWFVASLVSKSKVSLSNLFFQSGLFAVLLSLVGVKL